MNTIYKYPALFLSNDGKTEFFTNAIYASEEEAIADNRDRDHFVRLLTEFPVRVVTKDKRETSNERGAA